jgi:hypothetical protein
VEDSSDEDEEDMEEVRRFKEELQDDEKELLPLKIDGSLIRRIEKLDSSQMKDEEESLGDVSDIEEAGTSI